jgi:lipopolysaccharide/colanic/teichoic acid biosynthesis glycosyltransferase
MLVDSDKGPAITRGADRRITRVGRIIRPLRVDELPQLLNVLMGDMSLVGPRPEAPSIVERYTAEQREVLRVRPGITGPTQLVSLDEAAQIPTDADPTEYYVRHLLTQTFGGDLKILLRTPVCLGRCALAGLGFSRLLKATRRRPA